jgi:hypothetical protein
MTFDEAWTYIIGSNPPDCQSTRDLMRIANAFYLAGEVQAIERARLIFITANASEGVSQ